MGSFGTDGGPRSRLTRRLDRSFFYRAPRIEPTGQNKALRGTITVELAPRYYLTSAWDTLRFAVHIVDRDLQSSDTLRTDPAVKP